MNVQTGRNFLAVAILACACGFCPVRAQGQEQLPAAAPPSFQSLMQQRMPAAGAAVQRLPGTLPATEVVQCVELRLRRWSKNEIDVLAQAATLDDAQIQTLRNVADEFTTTEIRRLAQTPYTQEILRGVNRPCDDFPVLFTMDQMHGGKLRSLLSLFVRHGANLTPEQKGAAKAALDARSRFEGEALRDYILLQLDKDLFLSPRQRELVRTSVRPEELQFGVCLFSYDTSVPLFNGIPVATLQNLNLKAALSPSQASVLESIQSGGNSGTFQLQLPVTRDEWMKQLETAAAKQRDNALQLGEVRLRYYEEELKFPKEAVDRLRVAAKGTAVALADEWKAQMFRNLESNEQQMAVGSGTMGFGISSISAPAFESQMIWRDALTPDLQELRNRHSRERINEQHQILAKLLVAMLDRELSFTAAQRDELVQAVARVLPKQVEVLLQGGTNFEASWLAYPLLKLKPDVLTEKLSPDQIAHWEDLRLYYSPDPNANIVPGRVRILTVRGRMLMISIPLE